VSRFQKIFLASTLVVCGFSVAKFLGQPVLPTLVFNSRNTQPLAPPVVVQTANSAGGGSQAAGRARLLPDLASVDGETSNANVAAATLEPPRLGNSLVPVLATNNRTDISAMSRPVDFAPISSAPIGDNGLPRARLRNEAPRPVGIDPQSPAAIRRGPSEDVTGGDPYKVSEAKTAPSVWSAPPLLNAGYSDNGQSLPNAVPASYTAPATNVVDGQVAPPPWPAPEEAAELRTHIVADGDSLERLASRYLSDPQRSREIYELNRDVLSAPDLLPIGAELKIPERFASASRDRRGFQPNSANARSNREVSENMTPDRPAFVPQGIIPRAQLAPPMMVQ
jgi:hypothetical protein